MPFDGATIDETGLTLLRAAELIREKGLAKGMQHDPETDCVCVQGAISYVTTGRFYQSSRAYVRATARLNKYLCSHGVDMGDSIGNARWNNAPERTAEEVIAALEGAARS